MNHINSQIDQVTEKIKKNETDQQAMVEKIQKAKAYYAQMIQALQGKAWLINWMVHVYSI